MDCSPGAVNISIALRDELVKAAKHIQKLESQSAEKDARIQQLETERDAAVETIYEMAKCITDDVCEWCDQTECERLCMMHATERPGFKWRGVQKEE